MKQNVRKQAGAFGYPTVEILRGEIARCERMASYGRLAGGILAAILAAAAAVILVTNLWVSVLRVDGSSMNPLLQTDGIVLAVKSETVEKTDVIAFTRDNQLHIKRVIATAGDRVDIDSGGIVSVNGRPLDEPYITQPSLGSCDIEFPYTIPSGTVFVLGDNRADSIDSRDSRFGPVSREQLAGKVRFSIWPLSRLGSIA
ncbi:MAG: signal peptidase I [Oscillospiraceae bacterium]|nr:signal peptidase I [Oscillospiraceae bacterium]